MPAVSEKQERAMYAAAAGHSTLGIPQSVGKEFVGKSDDEPALATTVEIIDATINDPTLPAAATDAAPIAPQAGPAGRAAGILFTTPEGLHLWMHRGDGGDFPRTWGLPGGHQEPGETLEECARREALEETGFKYEGPLRKVHDDGQFCTYAADDTAQFPVTLCDESSGYTWGSQAPEPAHPGIANMLRVNAAQTETDIADLMRDGVLPSPQVFGNAMLLDIRISGTGAAYRHKLDEHVWRDPSLYLNDEFLRRCNGLPVILDHPDSKILTSDEFKDRICGTCVMPYIKGNEVWSIARILTKEAMEIIATEEISTSPGVLFDDESGNMKVMLEDGKNLLIEGKPALIDHIAIVTPERGSLGVWDKGGPATGVSLNNEEMVMADDNKKDDDAKADAAGGEVADKLLAAVDALAKRMDDMGKRMDEMAVADKSKKDDDKKADDDSKKDDAKAKADDDDEDDKKDDDRKDDAKKDEDDEGKYADAQSACDRVAAAFGERAPRPLAGENLLAYRRRLAAKYQAHSPSYKDINLRVINDEALLNLAEKQIYADAAAASRNPVSFGANQLVESRRTDATGRQISTFHGDPNAWMMPFRSQSRRVSMINNKGN